MAGETQRRVVEALEHSRTFAAAARAARRRSEELLGQDRRRGRIPATPVDDVTDAALRARLFHARSPRDP